ncbi:DUF4129 domain-containing transglutaminase family protein [Paenibacillus glufosinatiresistens]|uniref:DUF4129 domain-containing transglutaminase family protein n=1 Tax=Paenibacillus glufosinatiresistens TaxID=3070657 RepID=UPI00286D7191|nr:transglutaminase domain-containing protein [Paenibacillus sp. YX.27]
MRIWRNPLKDWSRAFAVLWLVIFAMQWVSVTESYWLQQTTGAVRTALLAAALLEILLPLAAPLRLAAVIAASIYTTFRAINDYGLYLPFPGAPPLEKARDLVSQMEPYLWFALGAAILLLLLSRSVSGRIRILLFLGLNLTALAALDSFTVSELWQETAWSVFAGLGWLVTDHLASFRKRYPHSWSYMLEYPFKIIANLVVVFSLILLAGVSVPSVRPTLTDPYTAWTHWQGEGGGSGASQSESAGKAAAKTGGTGSANTTSGYSNNDTRLGGGFAYDYSPVMTVVSDTRIYMRGETRAVYSGKGWTDGNRQERGALEEAEAERELANSFAPSVPTKKVRYSVRMLNSNRYPVIFGAYSISRIESMEDGGQVPSLSWRPRDGELIVNNPKASPYPRSYILTSEIPVVPIRELESASYEELYGGRDVPELFLQLPDSFPERVRELARKVTAEEETPYEKARALQQYLQQSFPYTNEPNLSLKKSRDFVDGFLFEVQSGYCDYYSTAMVTMARSLNIPARWVKGYAPGSQASLPDNLEMRGAANNSYTITNADAHSWAELYFGEYGWLPIEATPGFNAPLLTEKEKTPAGEEPKQPETPAANPAGPTQTDDSGFLNGAGPWLIGAAICVLALWGGFLLWNSRMTLRFLRYRLRRGRPLTPDEKVLAETERWLAFMKRRGFGRPSHETLRETVARWSGEKPAISAPLEQLLAWFEKARYSPEIIEDKDWQAVYTEVLRLRKLVKAGR